MRAIHTVVITVLATQVLLGAQAQTPPARRAPAPTPARRPAPAPVVPPTIAAADVTCPAPLGIGVNTRLTFCDVLSSRTPSEGVLIKIPPHRGNVTLSFDLHNRHTYSEEQVLAGRAFAHYTASIGVLTMDNTLVKRAAIDSEFRGKPDLVDRITGAGPGGVKAVAPTGTEHISVVIPKEEDQVSLLGEKLTVVDRTGQSATYTSTGRPIAIVSNLMIEYVAAPPPPPPRTPARK